jgi:hypothetical protein
MLLCDELDVAKHSAVPRGAGRSMQLQQALEQNKELGIAARGDATQAFSPKLQGAIAKLRKGKAHA